MGDTGAAAEEKPRTWFGQTLVLGLLGAGGLAVAGNSDWVRIDADSRAEAQAGVLWDSAPGLGQMPLAGALGLVALACWGVILVSGGLVRRVLAAAATLVGLGALAVWAVASVQLVADVEDRVGAAVLPGEWSVAWTAWFPVAGGAAVLAVAAGVMAWVKAPSWPTMSSRYDAPGSAAQRDPVDLAEADETDLWKAIDEGRDPTSGGAP